MMNEEEKLYRQRMREIYDDSDNTAKLILQNIGKDFDSHKGDRIQNDQGTDTQERPEPEEKAKKFIWGEVDKETGEIKITTYEQGTIW